MNKTNKTEDSQQVLINNLKKQLANKRSQYTDMVYRAAIIEIANQIIPVNENNYFNIDYLPNVSHSSFNKVVSPFASVS